MKKYKISFNNVRSADGSYSTPAAVTVNAADFSIKGSGTVVFWDTDKRSIGYFSNVASVQVEP